MIKCRGSRGSKRVFYARLIIYSNSGVSISLFSDAKLKKCASKLSDTNPACVPSRLSIGCGSDCVKNRVNSLCEGIRRHNRTAGKRKQGIRIREEEKLV